MLVCVIICIRLFVSADTERILDVRLRTLLAPFVRAVTALWSIRSDGVGDVDVQVIVPAAPTDFDVPL